MLLNHTINPCFQFIHILAKKKGTTITDNESMVDPAQVNMGTKHTQNTTDTPYKNNYDKEDCGEIVDDE